MVNTDQKTFRCELIGPAGKLLDCQTTSIVFPAHDGQVGILYDHMPMLSQLGLGVVRVAQLPQENHASADATSEASFLVDDGFALVAENSVTLIAYQALALQGIKTETIETLIDRTTKNLADPTLSPAQRAHESERLRTLHRAAESIKSSCPEDR